MFNMKKIAPRSSHENIVSRKKKTQEKHAATELLLRGIKIDFFPHQRYCSPTS